MNDLELAVIGDSHIIDVNKKYGSQMDRKSKLFIIQMLNKTEIERKELELQIINDIKTEEEEKEKKVRDAVNESHRPLNICIKILQFFICMMLLISLIIAIVLMSLSII